MVSDSIASEDDRREIQRRVAFDQTALLFKLSPRPVIAGIVFRIRQRGEFSVDVLDDATDGRQAHILLSGEVEVEGSLAEASLAGQIVHGHLAEAEARHDPIARVEDGVLRRGIWSGSMQAFGDHR